MAVDADRVEALATEFMSATADANDAEWLEPLSEFLGHIRTAFGMDIAFVSRFDGVRRVFEVVSARTGTAALRRGDSDALVDTYCQRIVDGRIPRVIRDSAAVPEVAGLPVTAALGIRAYLSSVVKLPTGDVFGTVCCISHATREDLTERDAAALQLVADAIAMSVTRSGAIRRPIWRRPDA